MLDHEQTAQQGVGQKEQASKKGDSQKIANPLYSL